MGDVIWYSCWQELFVLQEEVDSGEILDQLAVPILPGDTVSMLEERVKVAEHKLFPRALQNLADKFILEGR